MCGIAGIFLKEESDASAKIVTMLTAIEHRGPDSTGVAIFDGGSRELKAVIGGPTRQKMEEILRFLEARGVPHGEITVHPHFFHLSAVLRGEEDRERVIALVQSVSGTCVYSLGRSVTIIKDTFRPRALDAEFQISALPGSFALGHVRLATESRVNPFWSHPFQSLAMPDLCIVHNGQITNFYTKKRRLEKLGYKFQTDNDSEVIAQEIAFFMIEEQMPFDEALRAVARGLDGVFSLIVGAPNAMGIAKDKLATKPLMIAETGSTVALASEEIAIESVLGPDVHAEELAPGEVRVWKL